MILQPRHQSKLIMILFSLLLLAAATAGCGQATEPGGTASDAHNNPSPGTITITDSLDRTVSLSSTPQRIISLSPAITETLFAIGAEKQICGVTKYCDYPQQALEKPQIGDFKNPNLELIVELKPDLVCTAAGIQQDLVKQLEDLAIPVITLDATNVSQVLENIILTGQITGQESNATKLVRNLTARIQHVEAVVAEQVTHKPTVFFEVWDQPLMTAGPESFIDDLINMSGGINIASDAPKKFADYNLEILIQKDPDIYIINAHAHTPADIQQRPGFGGLQAVQKNHVYAIEDDLVTLPGPRLIDGLEAMAQVIHPDLF